MASGPPQDLDYFISLFSIVDVKTKVTEGSRLIAYLEDSRNTIECSDIGILIDDITQCLSSNVPRVCQHGIEIITHLIARMRKNFRPFISNLLPLVVNRLGDNNKEIRIKAHGLLMELMECDAISPRNLFDKTITFAFNHKNNSVKEGIMKLLVSTIEKFGVHTVSISKILPMIVKLLSGSNVQLRHKASETLVYLYKYIGEKLRVDIQKKYIIPPNTLRELMSKFDKAKFHIPGAGTPLSHCRPPHLPKPTTIDENAFIESFYDVPTIQISNARDLNDTMKKLHAFIQDRDGLWTKRVESLKQIRSLVLTGAMKYEEFFNNLQYTQYAFQVSVKDLRSQVVKETCITIAFLSQKLGIKFKLFAESIFIDLIDQIPNSVKIIASCALIAAKFILKFTHAPSIIQRAIMYHLGSKSKYIRRACCGFIKQILCTWQTHALEKHVKSLQTAIKNGIVDADERARKLSRESYWEFCKHFPIEGEILSNNLDPAYRKILFTNNSESNSHIPNFVIAENVKLPSRNSFTRQRSRSVIDLRSFQATRSRAQNKTPIINLNHLERIERPQDRDALSQASSRSESPLSSIESESSILSLSHQIDLFNWSEPQQQLSKEIIESILDIEDIITKCESIVWNDRREGLENLLSYLNQGNIINKELLKRLTDTFSTMLMDSQTKDIILFLYVLNELIDTHSQYLKYWLYEILSKLFHKSGSDLLGSVQSKILKTMEKIRLSFPYDDQLTVVFEFLTDSEQTPNDKMKILAMNYISRLTDTIDRGSMISNTEIDGRKDYADIALKKMMEWNMGDKIDQTPEVCNAVEEALEALRNLNLSEVTSNLCQLPDEFQEPESIKHNMKKINFSQLIAPKSPKPMIRKYSLNVIQQERVGRSRCKISSSQPSSRSGSPSSKSTCSEQNTRRGVSGIPRSRDVSREVSPNRYNSRRSHSSNKRPQCLPTPKSIMSQKILMPSPEAEFALADALCNKSSKKLSRTPFGYGFEDSTFDQSDLDSLDNAYVDPSDYLDLIKETNNMLSITKFLESDYTTDSVSPSREIDKSDKTARNEMAKILDILDNDTLPLDERKSNLNRLNEMLKTVPCDDLVSILQQMTKIILKLLTDSESTIREQSILWITYLVQKPDLVTYFFSSTELIILNVLEMCNDPCQSVVKASEECAYVLSAALQPETVVKVITPLISTKPFPVNLLAIRMTTKLVNKNGSYPVAAHMKDIMPSLLQAYEDRDITVRKSAVFCIVALNKVFDRQEFANYLSSLHGPKRKLLDLYIERDQQSSLTSSMANL